VRQLSDASVSILYMYSFLWKGKGVLVMRTEPAERAKEIVLINKIQFLTEKDF
jgi:hypothetical protein